VLWQALNYQDASSALTFYRGWLATEAMTKGISPCWREKVDDPTKLKLLIVEG
jgi:hypothetical protein